jgi:transcriptional regulator with XRE-family HTH domain
MSFWENVDAELEFRGMNRKTLAKEAEFDVSNIGKGIKTGSAPSADTAVRIAKILNVSVEYLVTGIPESATENQPTAAFKSFQKYQSLANTLEHLDENTREAIIELAEKLRG